MSEPGSIGSRKTHGGDGRKRTVLAASEVANALTRSLFDLAPDALLLVDADGAVVHSNQEAWALTGYSADELLGASVELLVPERLRTTHEGHRAGFAASPDRRPMAGGRELPLLRKDGGEVMTQIALGPIDSPAGPLVMVGMRDVSERHRMLRELEERTRLLEETNRELEAFSYSVSHDLRAPLRAIHGFARLLEEDLGDDLPAEARRHLEIIRQSSTRMGALIDDLLSFSRLGRTALARRPIDLDAMVRAVFDELRVSERASGASAGTDGAEREVALRVGSLGHCSADPKLLKQALANLLSNALKFTRAADPTLIEVERRRDVGGETVYSVRDNGVGFDPRYADKLFGVFQRLHRDEEFEGTGVGLALVQRILHRHGGRVWAESTPGNGATFFFTLGAGARA